MYPSISCGGCSHHDPLAHFAGGSWRSISEDSPEGSPYDAPVESEWLTVRINFRDPYGFQYHQRENCTNCTKDEAGVVGTQPTEPPRVIPQSHPPSSVEGESDNAAPTEQTSRKRRRRAKERADEDQDGRPTCQCPTCGKSCDSEKELRRHQRFHTKTLHKCSHCYKGYSNKAELTAHVTNVHLGVRAFSCSICSRTFTRSALLFLHLKLLHHYNFGVNVHVTER